jgi:hypothetical protein
VDMDQEAEEVEDLEAVVEEALVAAVVEVE